MAAIHRTVVEHRAEHEIGPMWVLGESKMSQSNSNEESRRIRQQKHLDSLVRVVLFQFSVWRQEYSIKSEDRKNSQ